MTKQERLEQLKNRNRTALPGHTVCAGSSLMEMFPVEKFIREKEIDSIVYNQGVSGFITDELLDNLDVCILDLKPSKLFINIGTNDLSIPDRSIEDLIRNYDRILAIVQEALPKISIYLMAYYPVNYEAAAEDMKACLRIRTNEKIRQANEAVEQLAEKYHAKYIDINAPLKDPDGNLRADFTIEGMHIKEEGYRSIFDAFMEYVREA